MELGVQRGILTRVVLPPRLRSVLLRRWYIGGCNRRWLGGNSVEIERDPHFRRARHWISGTWGGAP